MKRSYWKQIAALAAVIAIFICNPVSSAGASPGDQPTTAEVRKEIDQTLQTIGNYSAEQRDEALVKAKEALAKIDARLEQLQIAIDKHWQTMNQEARTQARQTQQDLQKKRTDIAEWYGGLKHSSTEAWEEIKQGFAKSYTNLETSLAKAREKF
jgi:hypothetical protein